MQWPEEKASLGNNLFSTALVIDATGEKIAMMGQFYNDSRSAKSIESFGFRLGAVAKAGGSGLLASLQDISTTSAPAQPDGTQDQKAAIANSNASFSSNTWITTGNLSSNRSVSFGEKFAVVIEFDGPRLGSDSVIISNMAQSSNVVFPNGGLFASGTWTLSQRAPNVIFNCSDGTHGTFLGASGLSDASSVSFNLNSATDEYANLFQLPFNCKSDGAWVVLTPTATSDFEVVLYDNTTPLATASYDASSLSAAGGRHYVSWSSEITLNENQNYILSVRPTTANNVTVNFFDVASAAHWSVTGVPTCSQVTRTNQGAWGAPLLTRRMLSGLTISAIETGGGGGGGLFLPRSHTGGYAG
jgi:hypothetical protein